MKIGVIGLGISGKKLVSAIERMGHIPVGFEQKSEEEFLSVEENRKFLLEHRNLEVIFNYSEDKIKKSNIDFVVLSSGVKHDTFFEKSIPFKSELDFVYENIPKSKKIILITGTKGKGTTLLLLSEILAKSGISHFAGGNIQKIGDKILTAADAIFSDAEFLIIEASSFQLRSSYTIRPHTLAITSLDIDHLDFHPSFFDYLNSKLKISKSSKFVVSPFRVVEILPRRYEVVENIGYDIYRKIFEIYSDDGSVIISDCTKSEIVISHILQNDSHYWNIQPAIKSNTLCAVGIASTILPVKDIKCDTIDIPKRKYCLEPLGEIDIGHKKIKVINDSKSTNYVSLANALLSFDSKVILIAGGRTKGFNFSKIRDIIDRKVEKAFLIGEAKEKLIKDFQNAEICKNLEDAFQKALKFAETSKSEVILFSPGGASQPDFQNAEERGRKFEELFKSKVANYQNHKGE